MQESRCQQEPLRTHMSSPKAGFACRGATEIGDHDSTEHIRIELFRGRPLGGDNFTSLFQVLQTLLSKRQEYLVRP